MTPEQEAKEREKFEEYMHIKYPNTIFTCYTPDMKNRLEAWLERARLDIRNIGSHDLDDFYKE